MKKFTLLIALFVCAIGFGQEFNADAATTSASKQNVTNVTVEKQAIRLPGSSFTSTSSGTSVLNGPAGSTTLKQSQGNESVNSVVITHSNTQTIAPGEGITCNAGGIANNNSLYRAFDLAGDFGIAGAFTVTAAEFGIETISNSFSIDVNIYSWNAFPGGSGTLQGSGTITVESSDAGTVVSVPVAATIPAGDVMVYEVVIVGDGSTSFFIGANQDGQTGPSWIHAPDCGTTGPTDLLDFGLTNSYVMNIIGDEGGGGSGNEWTVHVFDTGFGDEVSWELRDNTAAVILSGGGYGLGYDDTQTVNTSNEPLEFYIESMGTFNDNTPAYEISCSGDLVESGALAGGTEITLSDMECPGGGGPAPTVFITHSDFQTVNPGGSVACGSTSGGYTTENSYFRDFDLAQDFGIFNDFLVVEAEFGMQTVDQNHPMTINVYSLSGNGPLSSSFGDAVLQGTTGYTTTPADAGTVVNVPVSATIPAGDRLIFEVFISDGSAIPAQFRIGVNDLGQTDASYLLSASCGITDPLDVAVIGFPDMHLVMNILGDELVPQCDLTIHEATGFPIDIDGASTSTSDCTNAPNLFPVMVEGINSLGVNAFIDNVTFSLTHSWDSDLTISLVSPSGTELILSERNGGSGDDYIGTIFRDGGAPITGGSPPFTGTFAPEDPLGFSIFDGEFSAGEWNLKICDAVGGDTGTVFIFDMTICNFDVENNDTCEDSFDISCGDVIVGSTDTILHTDTGGNAAPDAWYAFVGSGIPEWVTLSLCDGGTDYDSVLRVFDACDGTEIATNDDACGLQSEVRFLSDGTSTYYVMVEGSGSSSGNFSMEVTCEPTADNDLCDDFIFVDCNSSIMGSNVNSTIDTDVAADCGTSIDGGGVWYVLNDNSGFVTDINVSLCSPNTDFDTKLSVYTGGCGELTCLVGNDDSSNCSNFQSEVDFQSDGNTQFYILVHGWNGAEGNFELTVTCTLVPPPNDDIANSIDVDEAGCPYTDVGVPMPGATTEGGNPVNCNIDGANGVWYNITPDGDGTITATVESPAGLSHVTFYTADDENASEGDLTLVDDPDNQCLPGTSTTVPVEAGQAYYIFVVNTGGRTDVSIECDLLGVNDNTIEGFSYYPNPANNAINLDALDTIESVVIYNILGQKVIDLNVEATNTQVNVSNLNTGTYLMKVSVNGQTGTYKLIKN